MKRTDIGVTALAAQDPSRSLPQLIARTLAGLKGIRMSPMKKYVLYGGAVVLGMLAIAFILNVRHIGSD